MHYINSNLLGIRGYEVTKTEGGADLEIAIPGFKREEIQIEQDGAYLVISAENKKYSFYKKFSIPQEVDLDKIAAKLEDGVLTINLPQSNKSKKILIH